MARTRIIRRRKIVHQLVAVSEGKVTTRCGQQWKKPKAGFGEADSFGANCSDCDEATRILLATTVVPT